MLAISCAALIEEECQARTAEVFLVLYCFASQLWLSEWDVYGVQV
jgi:hypothetical protein